jgi:Arm DNA-binding domain
MRKSLTQLFVDKINPPKSGRREYFDSHLTGFGLRVSASGNKSWFVLYRVRGSGKQIRETLGKVYEIPQNRGDSGSSMSGGRPRSPSCAMRC